MMTPTMTPMIVPIEPLVSTAMAAVNSGGGGGAALAIVGGVTTASTAIETPVTFTSMAVALLGLLVALDITDCTEAAITVGVRMRTLTMTLPGDMVSSTADGSTPARAAVALLIWDCTLGVNEETSPASLRVNPTTLIVSGGDGGGGEGEGGGGEGGGGGGEGEGGGGDGGGGGSDGDDGGGDCDGGGGDGDGGGGDGDGGGGVPVLVVLVLRLLRRVAVPWWP